jgi:hypothetical protein
LCVKAKTPAEPQNPSFLEDAPYEQVRRNVSGLDTRVFMTAIDNKKTNKGNE